MDIDKAYKQAVEEMSQAIYITETTTNAGIATIYDKKSSMLSMLTYEIKRQKAEIEILQAENASLKARLEKATELLNLAVADLQMHDICGYCGKVNANECDCECESCEDGCFCRDCEDGSEWEWQYQQGVNELKAEKALRGEKNEHI